PQAVTGEARRIQTGFTAEGGTVEPITDADIKAAPGTGVVVVDVATTTDDGPRLAAWVSSGNVRLVLDAPGGS
ncbi:hypothetical protein ABZT43_44730, partial [Streptomyces sp. NPDC005349]